MSWNSASAQHRRRWSQLGLQLMPIRTALNDRLADLIAALQVDGSGRWPIAVAATATAATLATHRLDLGPVMDSAQWLGGGERQVGQGTGTRGDSRLIREQVRLGGGGGRQALGDGWSLDVIVGEHNG